MACLITPQELQTIWLAGVNLNDSTGTPFPNIIYETLIKSAISWFEEETHIFVLPTTITNEPHDYHRDEYGDFCFIKVYNYPLQSVQSLIASYPTGQTLLLYPASWIRIYINAGEIRVTPTNGSLSQILIGQSGSYMPLLSGSMPYFPQLFKVNYTAGFKKDEIPDVVNQIIGMKAAIGMLAIANNSVLQPGIGSASVDIDGLNQSMTVASGKYGPYSPMINIYQDLMKDMVANVKLKYQGIPFAVL